MSNPTKPNQQRKVVVANKMLEKKAKVYVEEKKNRLLNIFQSASGNVRFGGETRSLDCIPEYGDFSTAEIQGVH